MQRRKQAALAARRQAVRLAALVRAVRPPVRPAAARALQPVWAVTPPRNVTVPYMAMLMRSQGKSDTSISTALRQDGYSSAEIAQIPADEALTVRMDINKKHVQSIGTGAVPARGVLHMLFFSRKYWRGARVPLGTPPNKKIRRCRASAQHLSW